MNTFTFFLGGILAMLLGAICVFTLMNQPHIAGASFIQNNLPLVATTTAAFTFTTSTRVLATTTNPLDPANSRTRIYSTICTTGTVPVAISMNSDKAVSSSNITTFIAAAAGYNNCYEINDRNSYQGSIVASSTVGAVTVVVSDYLQ